MPNIKPVGSNFVKKTFAVCCVWVHCILSKQSMLFLIVSYAVVFYIEPIFMATLYGWFGFEEPSLGSICWPEGGALPQQRVEKLKMVSTEISVWVRF